MWTHTCRQSPVLTPSPVPALHRVHCHTRGDASGMRGTFQHTLASLLLCSARNLCGTWDFRVLTGHGCHPTCIYRSWWFQTQDAFLEMQQSKSSCCAALSDLTSLTPCLPSKRLDFPGQFIEFSKQPHGLLLSLSPFYE